MKSSKSGKKKAVSAGEISELAAIAVTALVRGGEIPPAVPTLSGRQYTDLLERIDDRIGAMMRAGQFQVHLESLDSLLRAQEAVPLAKQTTDCFAAQTRLAITCDPGGLHAFRCVERAIDALSRSAADSERLSRRLGPSLLPILSQIASQWIAAPPDDRPTSEATGTFARLLALQFVGGDKSAAEGRGSALGDLARVLGDIRVTDLQGAADPLLLSLAEALERRAQTQTGRPSEPIPSKQAGLELPPLSPVENAISGLRNIAASLEREFHAVAEIQDQATSLRMENAALRSERDTLDRTAGDLRWHAERLNLQLEELKSRASEMKAEVEQARAHAAGWRQECDQERVQASAVIKHTLGAGAAELVKLLERYGVPAKVIADQPAINEAELSRLRVNVGNFVQKVEKVANRIGGATADTDRTGDAAREPSQK